MKTVLFVALLLLFICLVLAEDTTQTNDYESYFAAKPTNFELFEDFQSEPSPLESGKWILSSSSKYAGQNVQVVELSSSGVHQPVVGIPDNKGLLLMQEAKHYGIAAPVSFDLSKEKNKNLVFQYEVKFEKSLECGGAYVKLLHKDSSTPLSKLQNFDDKSDYVIMFGPDRCGSTDKVHFIFRHYNPISKTWEEKHLKDAPTIKNDALTHLYTLIVRADNSFEILIDNETARSGSLLEDFLPAVNPPKEIPDPEDKKPSDWVDEEFIDDPNDSKPDDWDENELPEIVDEEDEQPEGWLEDAPLTIPDPDAKKPEEWDDEEDGQWIAPQIPNPACKVGCGKYTKRMIRNPKYKGKWSPKKIQNPAWKGVWKARLIPNPNYFEDKNPALFPAIGALAIEIWTMQKNMFFDNFLLTTSEQDARDFAEQTWKLKHQVEKEQQPKPPQQSTTDLINQIGEQLVKLVNENPSIAIATGAALLLSVPLMFLCLRCVTRAASQTETIKEEETKEKVEEEEEKEDEETKVVESKESVKKEDKGDLRKRKTINS